MNMMWVSSQPFNPSTGPSNAIAVRKRLMNPPIAKTAQQAPTRTTLLRFREPADAHVDAWRAHVAESDPLLSVADYIRLRCKAHKVAYLDIIGQSQADIVVVPRHLIMFEVSQRFPNISRYQIGKAFGGRDPTTVFSALCKLGYVPHQIRVTPEMADEMRRLYAEGMQKKAIGKLLGVSGTTVTSHVDPELAEAQRIRLREFKRRAAEAKRAEAA